MSLDLGVLRFEEAYSERVWGGDKLRERLGKPTPAGQVTGEAWLIADHASHESVVLEGPYAGRTLRSLLEEDPAAVLGSQPEPTRHGRFPLLLKLLDCHQQLSVQVHPDDAAAEALNEPDVGKTEMWYFIEADAGADLVCGLKPGVDRETFRACLEAGDVDSVLKHFGATAGTPLLLPAGTVHGVGGGVLIAEIQQNSDITYRIHDWNRMGTDGRPRELHIEKALAVTHFDVEHPGGATALSYAWEGCRSSVLGACRFFCGELLETEEGFSRATGGASFHLLLAHTGTFEVLAGGEVCTLHPGEAAMVPGQAQAFEVHGSGVLLDYYVPDLAKDVVAPLSAAGHSREAILLLGGDASGGDIAGVMG